MRKLIVRLILEYLRVAARLQLKKNNKAIIIGITGSAGKTSCRLALAAILRTRGRTKHSVAANSESGIPLNILGLKPTNFTPLDWMRLILLTPVKLLLNWEKFDYYIVEMGIDSPDEPKNMSYLLTIVQPDIGVVLNAGLSHAENFDHLVKDRNPARRQSKIRKLIAAEKMKLAGSLKKSNTAIINADQKELSKLAKHIRARIITFGKSKRADLHLQKITIDAQSCRLECVIQGRTYTVSTKSILSPAVARTFLAAIAAAVALRVPIKDSLVALRSYESPPGRLRRFVALHDSTLIDSSYNASPETMKETLELLANVATKKAQKVAIIGDMRELGQAGKSAHKELAGWIMKSADEAVLFGHESEKYTLPILQQAHFPVHHFTKMTDLIQHAQSKIPKNSWILVKGSQNQILLERAVEALLADPADITRLARRGPYWDKIRENSV